MRIATLMATLLTLGLAAPALADDIDEDSVAESGDDDFFKTLEQGPDSSKPKPKTEDEKLLSTLSSAEEDIFADVDMAPPPPPPTAKLAVSSGPGPIPLDVTGKKPLADNYAVSVVHVDRSAVVVELPVLVAAARASVEGGFQIIGEVFAGDQKVTVVSQRVEPASLAEYGPSFVFLKALVPVAEQAGAISVVVKRAKLDGSGAEELFRRSTTYSMM